MALIDLDKIIVKRTILGIRCTVCGGNLVIYPKKAMASRIVRFLSLGTVRAESYQCETCTKRYLLL